MKDDQNQTTSDYEKLMDLAIWFDVQDQKAGTSGQDEVQRDLRRIARRLLDIDGAASFTRGQPILSKREAAQ